MKDKIVIMTKWTETLKKRMTPEQYNEACARIIEYGANKENYKESDDIIMNLVLDQIFVQMDSMEEVYSNRVNKSGRKKTIDSRQVWEMAQEGLSAQEIANALGVKVDGIYKDLGWKNRENIDF